MPRLPRLSAARAAARAAVGGSAQRAITVRVGANGSQSWEWVTDGFRAVTGTSPGLAEIMREEASRGLDPATRVAMVLLPAQPLCVAAGVGPLANGALRNPQVAGGFTERRYTAMDVLELQVLADLLTIQPQHCGHAAPLAI